MNEPSPSFLSSPDAGGRGAGELIRRAREAQGMTLEALASMIKVTPAKLEALEQGRHEQLPDANFTRALAMTVCRALKVDPGEILAALPAAKPAPLAEGKPPLNQPFKEARGGAPLFDRQSVNWSSLLTLRYLAPAALLIGAVVIYALPDAIITPPWSASSSQPADPAVKPDGAEPASVTQVVPVQPQVASGATAAPGASAAAPSGLDAAVTPAGAIEAGSTAGGAVPVVEGVQPASVAPVTQIEPRLQSSVGLTPPPATPGAPAPPGSGALSIAVTQSTWIDVRDGQGRKLLSRLAQPGENLSLDGPAPWRVRIGNVAGTQLRYQGQPVDLAPFARNNVARIELK